MSVWGRGCAREGAQFDSLHKSAICAIMRQVPFDYDTMTRSIRTHTHTLIHAFSLPHSCCLLAIVGVATWPEVGWGGALSVSSSKSNLTKSAIVMSPA